MSVYKKMDVYIFNVNLYEICNDWILLTNICNMDYYFVQCGIFSLNTCDFF